MAFVVDAGQVDEDGMIDSGDEETITGAYIRENGTRIPKVRLRATETEQTVQKL